MREILPFIRTRSVHAVASFKMMRCMESKLFVFPLYSAGGKDGLPTANHLSSLHSHAHNGVGRTLELFRSQYRLSHDKEYRRDKNF